MTISTLCGVCRKVEKKYKCPVCFINYCSLACFKVHKINCNSFSQSEDEDANTNTENFKFDTAAQSVNEDAFLFSTPDTVPLEKLQQLSKSEKLKTLLTNKHLRDFLTFLDASDDKAMLMRKAMREPLFVEFVDACLESINPEYANKYLTDEELLQGIKEQVDNDEDD